MIVLAFVLSLMASSSQAVTIVHSNDVLGDIEPCGCRTNPLGGFARKANLLKGLADREIIQIDAGDLLFPSSSMPEVLRKQSVLQAAWVLKILDLEHLDAVTPGEKDFALGVDTFLKLIRKSQVHFIAANLRRSNGKSLLPDSIILKRKDTDGKQIRVAILGLVGSDIGWPASLKVTDPIATAVKRVAALRKKADYVIALTHEGLDADKNLAESVKGIDLIVGGHTQSFLQNPIKIGSTTIFQSSFRNQYVGLISLPLARPLNDDSYKMIGLDSGYDSPSELPGPVDQAVRQFKAAVASLNSKNDAVLSYAKGPAHYQTFARCAECHLKQFDFWRKTAHANALAPLVKAKQDKNKECLLCHTLGLGSPGGFNNVNALAVFNKSDDTSEVVPAERFVDYLASVHDGKDLNAPVRGLSSENTITIDQSLGRIKEAWTPVQCENCHGPGGEHPMSGQIHKAVETTVCLTCHTATRAPGWYKADGTPDWEKIKTKHSEVACPAGDMSSEN